MKTNKGYIVIEFLFVIIVGVVIIGGVIIGPMVSYGSVDQTTITVKDKERVCESNNDGGTSCRYLIYTKQGVYENTDSFVQFKFNSSDVYNELEAGKTYDVTVNWFRVPFLSMYENILEIR